MDSNDFEYCGPLVALSLPSQNPQPLLSHFLSFFLSVHDPTKALPKTTACKEMLILLTAHS